MSLINEKGIYKGYATISHTAPGLNIKEGTINLEFRNTGKTPIEILDIEKRVLVVSKRDNSIIKELYSDIHAMHNYFLSSKDCFYETIKFKASDTRNKIIVIAFIAYKDIYKDIFISSYCREYKPSLDNKSLYIYKDDEDKFSKSKYNKRNNLDIAIYDGFNQHKKINTDQVQYVMAHTLQL